MFKRAWTSAQRGRTASSDGLLVDNLLEAFQEYFRQESEHWQDMTAYKEAGPHLLLHAFLQRVVNGGGRIEREYALGLGRTGLLILWPHGSQTQKFVIECKILRDILESTVRKGLMQIAGYIDRCSAQAGHLVIFDRSKRPWKDRIFRKRETVKRRSHRCLGRPSMYRTQRFA